MLQNQWHRMCLLSPLLSSLQDFSTSVISFSDINCLEISSGFPVIICPTVLLVTSSKCLTSEYFNQNSFKDDGMVSFQVFLVSNNAVLFDDFSLFLSSHKVKDHHWGGWFTKLLFMMWYRKCASIPLASIPKSSDVLVIVRLFANLNTHLRHGSVRTWQLNWRQDSWSQWRQLVGDMDESWEISGRL